MTLRCEVAIVGGGPAGLAAAARLSARGFDALVLERAGEAPDKACGEGLMPRGLRELSLLGVRDALDPAQCAPFEGIRYVQEDGRAVEARFADGPGLGVRRLELSRALWARASALGARRLRCLVRGHRLVRDGVRVETDEGEVEAQLLVGADGLASPTRRAAGLEAAPGGPRRFGLRRHFAREPWCDLVEVHWHKGVEAYVTPVGAGRINVAFLWDDTLRAHGAERLDFDALLSLFPALGARLKGAPCESQARGAGPLLRPVRGTVGRRVALLGDAAGYVDAITGQGLSLAFTGAALLSECLPASLEEVRLARALVRYARALRRQYRSYALPAQGLLLLASRPSLRRTLLGALSARPALFSALLRAVE